jgi:hypothetical protein
MNDTVRLKVSLGMGVEFNIEGSVAIVEKYDSEIHALLAKLVSEVSVTRKNDVPESTQSNSASNSSSPPTENSEDFGELLHRLPRSASAVDKVLIAGWFAQRENGGQAFETKDASRLLLGHGVKLANPSQSMTNNLKRKHLFKAGAGYRLSREGQQYVSELIGK